MSERQTIMRTRRTTRPAVAVLAVVATIWWFPNGTAQACSCAPATPTQLIQSTDAGFIGTLEAVDRSTFEAVFSFDVEVWLNGDLESATVEVDAPSDGASCGIEVPEGGRAAVFVSRSGERLQGSLCSTLDADATLAALEPPSTPGGDGAFAVSGVFERGSFALLDAGGRLIGYRGEPVEFDPGQIYPCADGRHVVNLGFPIVEVIDLSTFEVVERVDTQGLQQEYAIDDVACEDESPDNVRLLMNGSDFEEQEIRTLSSWEEADVVLPRAPAARTVLTASGLFANEPQDPGDLLVKIDLDGTRIELERIERPNDSNFAGYESMVPEPSGERVAVSQVTFVGDAADARLTVRDASTGAEIVGVDLDEGVSILGWADGSLLTRVQDRLQIRATDTLDVSAEVTGRGANGATLVAQTVWGVQAGRIVRASVTSGDVEIVETLPTQFAGEVLALLEPVPIDPVEAGPALLNPRQPAAITDAEITAREQVEAAPDRLGFTEDSFPWTAVAIGVGATLAMVGAAWRRSRRTEASRHG